MEIILGSNKKKFTINETNIKKVVRKSLVTNKLIRKGSRLRIRDIVFKRPGTGISPMKISKLIGKKAKKSYKQDEILNKSEI